MAKGAYIGIGINLEYESVFANNSWTQIIKACQKKEVPDTWRVGDQKDMQIDGVTYAIDIIGKNHDAYSDGSGVAPLTFQLHDCYNTTSAMRNSSGNRYTDNACVIRATTLPNILAKMPSEVQSAISEINKLTAQGTASDSSTWSDYTHGKTTQTSEKLFLLSEIEVFGVATHSTDSDVEGSQYEYYAASNSRVKNVNGAANEWWLRSPCQNTATYFCAVNTSGNTTWKARDNSLGVSFAFCFGGTSQINDNFNKIGDLEVGSIVQINENGSPVEFYVAKHDYESDLNGTGRTLLVRKSSYPELMWWQATADTQGSKGLYDNSTIDRWLNNTYKFMLDSVIQELASTTTFYYTYFEASSVAGQSVYRLSTLSKSIFLLSANELNVAKGNILNDGTALSVASEIIDNDSQYFLRSLDYYHAWPIYIDTNGEFSYCSEVQGDANSPEYYPRPCFTLPSNLLVGDNDLITGQTNSDSNEIGDLEVGSIVQINENGSPVDYIIVHQGNPDTSLYDASCDGTWVLRKDIYTNQAWDSNQVNDYANSTIHSYLNGDLLSIFDTAIQSKIKQVKIPYRAGSGYATTVTSGVNGLSTKVFLLSATEAGFNFNGMPTGEGVELSYFSGCADDGTDSKRIANLNGSADYWWTRSPVCSSAYRDERSLAIQSDGQYSANYSYASLGVRPAFIISNDTTINSDGLVVGASTETSSGSVARKIKKIYIGVTEATNLVTNGSFESMDGWVSWGGSVQDSTQSLFGAYSVKLTGDELVNRSVEKPIVGHTYYAREYIKTDGDIQPTDCRFEVHGGDGEGLNWVYGWNRGNYPDWTMISAVNTINVVNAENYVLRTFALSVTTGNIWLDGVMLIDLTATYGEGNEPTKEWCDANIPFFEGTHAVPNLSFDGANAPYYEESVVTIAINSSNIADMFEVTNGSYYFAPNSDGTMFYSNNKYQSSTTASTVLKAKYDMNISFTYTYSSEQNYDKFTLKVAGTTIENEVSGSSQTKTYSGNLTVGQTIEFTYTKDGSQDKNNDECSFREMSVTTTVMNQVRFDNIARQIKKAYIGIGGVARPCWPEGQLAYYGTITPLSEAKFTHAGASSENHAIFAGGETGTALSSVANAYDNSLTLTTLDKIATVCHSLVGVRNGEFAIFAGGLTSLTSTNKVTVYDSSLIAHYSVTLSTSRYDLAGAYVGEYALFVGGRSNSTTVVNAVDSIDRSLTRAIRTTLPSVVYRLAGVSADTKAIFAGGQIVGTYRASAYSYDESLTRTAIDDISVKRSALCGASVGDYALLAGGENADGELDVVDAYNSSLTKTVATPLSQKRMNLAAVEHGGFAMFVGGESNGEIFATVDMYDASLTRTTNLSLSNGKTQHAAATVENFALIAGGLGAPEGYPDSVVEAFTIV